MSVINVHISYYLSVGDIPQLVILPSRFLESMYSMLLISQNVDIRKPKDPETSLCLKCNLSVLEIHEP